MDLQTMPVSKKKGNIPDKENLQWYWVCIRSTTYYQIVCYLERRIFELLNSVYIKNETECQSKYKATVVPKLYSLPVLI